jgi:rRNA maturation endonuclease Nob1
MIFGIVAVFVPIYKPAERQFVLICPKCQSRIPVSSKFCPECGADLRPKELSEQKKNQNL